MPQIGIYILYMDSAPANSRPLWGLLHQSFTCMLYSQHPKLLVPPICLVVVPIGIGA